MSNLGRPFSIVWTSATVSTLGDGVRLAALPLLAATISTDPLAVAAVALAGQLPWLLLAVLTGAIADRADRRTIMWTVDLFRAGVLLLLVGLVVADKVGIAALCAIAFILGSGQTLFDNAAHALLPSIVPQAGLAAANNRLLTARVAIGSFLGPPLGGVLFTTLAFAPFALNAASFGVAALLVGVFFRPVRRPEPLGPKRSLLADIAEGLRWVAKHQALRALGLVIAVVNFTQSATQSILVLLALEELQLGQREFGLMLAAMGLGALLGGAFGAPLRRRLPPGALFAATILITIPIFLVIGTTSNALVVGAMLALNAFAGINAGVLMRVLQQTIVPDRLLARVNGVMGLLGVGLGLPLGALAGGLLADGFGLRAPFLVSAALITVASIALPSISRSFTASKEGSPSRRAP